MKRLTNKKRSTPFSSVLLVRKTDKVSLFQNERRCFYLAMSFLIIVISAYIYFLSASVVHVVIRKEIDAEIKTIHTKISTLETKYIESQHKMSNQVATMKGYISVHKKVFIENGNTQVVLSRN